MQSLCQPRWFLRRIAAGLRVNLEAPHTVSFRLISSRSYGESRVSGSKTRIARERGALSEPENERVSRCDISVAPGKVSCRRPPRSARTTSAPRVKPGASYGPCEIRVEQKVRTAGRAISSSYPSSVRRRPSCPSRSRREAGHPIGRWPAASREGPQRCRS